MINLTGTRSYITVVQFFISVTYLLVKLIIPLPRILFIQAHRTHSCLAGVLQESEALCWTRRGAHFPDDQPPAPLSPSTCTHIHINTHIHTHPFVQVTESS